MNMSIFRLSRVVVVSQSNRNCNHGLSRLLDPETKNNTSTISTRNGPAALCVRQYSNRLIRFAEIKERPFPVAEGPLFRQINDYQYWR